MCQAENPDGGVCAKALAPKLAVTLDPEPLETAGYSQSAKLLNAAFVPAAGPPDANHVPFLPHQIFRAAKSTATITTSPGDSADP